MKHLGKYIISLTVLTGCMLLFVHQQISIIQCSYKINKNESVLAHLKEDHKNLKFQLASYTSPVSLNEKLAAADINLVFPEQITVVKIPTAMEAPLHLANAQPQEPSGIFKMLGFAREAQANETK